MRHACLLPLLIYGLWITGCASRSVPDATRNVPIRLHAASTLNADAGGTPLAVVARIYALRHDAVFREAPYDAFLSSQRERDVLGGDLIDVKEVTLLPGQRYEVVEKISRDAAYVGVVALFHSPAPQRWRLSYPVTDAADRGITVGVLSCSLSNGALENAIGPRANLLSPVRCQ